MMRFAVVAFAVVVGAGMVAQDAEAKRMGGGKSIGMQRDAPTMQRQAVAPQTPAGPAQAGAPAAAAPAAAGAGAAAAAPAKNAWLGPLAGLAIGAGLATMFAGTPFGGFLGALALGVLVFFAVMLVMRMLRARQQQGSQPLPYAAAGPAQGAPTYFDSGAGTGSAAPTPSAHSGAAGGRNIPADFDVEGFLRQAKLNFIRLQAANDAGNIEDIRNFTSPEMFAEIRLQIQERGSAAQTTDVVTLQAEVLDVAEIDRRYVVSVRFYGAVREAEDGQPEPFDEVWHLSKPMDGAGGWVIGGIQQFELTA